jgi:tRNA nucleotidyltransferase (CCA-adding enzyme)
LAALFPFLIQMRKLYAARAVGSAVARAWLYQHYDVDVFMLFPF